MLDPQPYISYSGHLEMMLSDWCILLFNLLLHMVKQMFSREIFIHDIICYYRDSCVGSSRVCGICAEARGCRLRFTNEHSLQTWE